MHDINLLQLLLVMLLALAVPSLLGRLRRFRVPAVVAEILAGILVGKSGLNLVQPDSGVLAFLAYLGLAYLMLLSGLEIDFSLFKRGGRNPKGFLGLPQHPLVLSLIFLSFGVGGSFLVAGRLGQAGLIQNVPVAAFILATSALTMVVPVLKEQGLASSPFGQILLASNALLDFVPMLGLTIVLAWGEGSVWQAMAIIPAIGLVLLLWRAGIRIGVPGWLQRALRTTAQLGTRASLVLLLLFLFLAEKVGIEAVIAAFLAGMLLSLLTGEGRHDFSQRADAVGFGFLIPIFFVLVGVKFDLRAVLGDPKALLLVPLILLASLLTKGVPMLLLRFWHPWRRTLGAALLSSVQISVTIAAATVAAQAGAISSAVQMAVILAAMLSSLFWPTLFLKLVPQAGPEEAPPILLAGDGALPALLLHRLLAEGRRVLFYGRTDLPAQPNFEHRGEHLSAAELPEVPAVGAALFLYGDDERNVELAEAMSQQTEATCMALVERPTLHAEAAGRVRLVSPATATVDLIDSLLERPVATQVLAGGGNVQMFEATLSSSRWGGKAMRDLRLPPGCLVALIYRGGHALVPRGDTVLWPGDILTVVAPTGEEEEIRRLLD